MSRRTTLKGAIIPVWEKFTADSVTLVSGTSSDVVTDLQTAFDGNIYDLTEAAASPGQDLIVDFVDISIFHFVRAIAYYDGSGTHSVNVEVWNWTTSAWDVFDAMNGVQKTMTDQSVFVIDHTIYIGTGVNSGRVRVRLNHTQMGNVAHHTFIDEISLRRFT
jgi:hypothetical protein